MAAALFRPLLVTAALVFAAGLAAADEVNLTAAAAVVATNRVTGQPEITITLSPASRADFAAFTQANVGRLVTLKVRGAVIAQATLVEPIAGGVVTLSGLIDKARIEEAARVISAGAIPLVFTSTP